MPRTDAITMQIIEDAFLAIAPDLQRVMDEIYQGKIIEMREFMGTRLYGADLALFNEIVADKSKFDALVARQVEVTKTETIHHGLGRKKEVLAAWAENEIKMSPLLNPLKTHTNLQIQIARKVRIEASALLKKVLEVEVTYIRQY